MKSPSPENVGSSSQIHLCRGRLTHEVCDIRLKVEFLRYPFTLAIGFLDSCRMLRSDNAQPREEQLTMADGDSTLASGAFAS
jgi:hypothetical protein